MSAPEKLKQPTTTLASWDTTLKILRIMTHNRRRSDFVEEHQVLLHHFYDAYFDIAAGNGRKKLDTLKWQYTDKEYAAVVKARFPLLEVEE
jgi:hypothetical protein